MVDMLAWPDRRANVLNDLILDPRNVRLDIDVDAPEVDIMRDLFANERVLNLVEGISKVGYLTHEIPLAVERDGQLIVVEGNRRVAALKAIQNPFLAADYQARVAAFAQRITNRDALREITVRIAPSQSEADEVIAAIHTANLRRPWSPTRQGAFFQAQVDAGGTLPELISRYPTADVRRFVFRSLVLNKFRAVPYRSLTLRDYVHKRTFSVSTLARVYESAKFIKLLGLKMSSNGRLTSSITQATFNEIAEFIIDGMNEGSYSTRTLNTTESPTFIALIDHVTAILLSKSPAGKDDGPAPENSDDEPMVDEGLADEYDSQTEESETNDAGDKSDDQSNATGSARDGDFPKKSIDSDTASDESGDAAKDSTPTQAPKRPPRKQRLNLQTSGLRVPDSYPNAVIYIFAELSSINVVRYPNAALDLIRSFLEKTIKAYADAQASRIAAGPGGQIQLAQCLVWLEDYVKQSNDRSIVPVIKKLQSGKIKEYAASTMYLNDLNHNQNIFAEPEDVHGVWNSMDGLLRLMLR